MVVTFLMLKTEVGWMVTSTPPWKVVIVLNRTAAKGGGESESENGSEKRVVDAAQGPVDAARGPVLNRTVARKPTLYPARRKNKRESKSEDLSESESKSKSKDESKSEEG
jgi:hypothetical protein